MNWFLTSLFTPHPSISKHSREWSQARMTIVVSLIVLLIYALPEMFLTTREGLSLETIVVLLEALFSLAAYLLARTPAYRWSIYILLFTWTGSTLELFLEPADATSPVQLLWPIFGLLTAFLLLSPRGYGLYAVLLFSLMLGVGFLVSRFTATAMSAHTMHFTAFAAAASLLGLGNFLRHRAEEERESVQRALLEQRDYLQRVIDGIQSPFYVIDAATYRIRLANQAARQLGISEQASTCYQLTHRRETPCTDPEHPCPLQRVTAQRAPYIVEHIHYKSDGTPYYAEVHGYPLFDPRGQVTEMLEYSIDITERKRAEEKIRKLERAVEHAASGVIITNAEGIIEYANPNIQRMTGYSLEEFIGQTLRLLKSGKMPVEVYADLWHTIKSGRVWQGELINRRKDGSEYYEFQTIAPVRNTDGVITHFVAITLDITRQKEMEAALREEKERAEAASRFKSRLLANVSHDMRTPLGAIIGYGEMLKDEVFGKLSEEQKEKIGEMINAAQRLNAFITNLLNQAELESGKLRLNPRPFAPQELLKVLTPSFALANWKGLQVNTEIDPQLPPQLHGDLYWLQQILSNLTDNAIKYTESGQIWVRLRRADADHWAMEVQDTGIGIAPEMQERIFEPFEQAVDSEKRHHTGAGLGLAIVKQLVVEMNGEIRLQSAPGAGSTFTIILPLRER